MKKVEIIKKMFIMLVLYFTNIFAQVIDTGTTKLCPQGTKLSKVNNNCISNTICDGYQFRNTTNCLDKNPSIKPQYFGQPCVYCILTDTTDVQSSLFICNNCTDPLKPIGPDCTGCKEDEYLYTTISPFKCIKKIDFGLLPYNIGVISEDYKVILPQCNPNQIITENTIQAQNNTILKQKLCFTCPQEKVLSFDRMDCLDKCEVGEIKDTRNPKYSICLKWWSCNSFSQDASSCVAQCRNGEIFQQISQNIRICIQCSGSKPYVSLDQTQCVSDCGVGNIYSEEQQRCILLTDCTYFVHKGVCTKEDCTIRRSYIRKPDIVIINSPPGAKYKLCKQCPDNAPFIKQDNPSLCGDCSTQEDKRSEQEKKLYPYLPYFNYEGDLSCQSPTDKFIPYGQRNPPKFDSIEHIPLPGFFSLDEKVVYNDRGCPSGQVDISYYAKDQITSRKCTPCTYQNEQNKCCQIGEFYDKNQSQCVSNCELYSSDFTCIPYNQKQELPSCNSGEIAKTVLITYKDQSQKVVKKSIPQCLLCSDPRINGLDLRKNFSEETLIKLKKCFILFYASKQGDDYTVFNWPNKMENPCPQFSGIGQPARYFDRECKQCPIERPFWDSTLVQNDPNKGCSACLGKIKDYGSARCVSSIDQIINPGSGIFTSQRMEYWPKTVIEKSGCVNSFVQFSYKQFGLKECPPQQLQQPCDGTIRILDERTQSCILPEMCSLILSRDRKQCSLNPCSVNEIFNVPQQNLDIQNFSVNTLNPYLVQCQICPQQTPYILNNVCVNNCGDNMVFLYDSIKCISIRECSFTLQSVISNSGKNCVKKCNGGNIKVGKIQDKTYFYDQCEACPSNKPFSFERTCVEKCPPQHYNDSFQCTFYFECKLFINTEKNECLKSCPQGQLIHNQNFCVEKCPPLYYIDSGKCIDYLECPKIASLEKNECIESCPQDQFIQKRSLHKIKFCVQECYDDQWFEPKIRLCEEITTCQKVVYQKQCIEKCPDGFGLINKGGYQPNVCYYCSNNRMYYQDGGCKLECSGNFFPDQSTFKCLHVSMCDKVLSQDGKFCLQKCPNGQKPSLQETNPILPPTILQCIPCPKESPYSDFIDGVQICTKRCRIGDIRKRINPSIATSRPCYALLNDCDGVLISQEDGTYICDQLCPYSFIIKKECNSKENGCYNICTACPKETLYVEQNKCVSKCQKWVNSGTYQCYYSFCRSDQYFDIDQGQCMNSKQIIDRINIEGKQSYFTKVSFQNSIQQLILSRRCPLDRIAKDYWDYNMKQYFLLCVDKRELCPSNYFMSYVDELPYCTQSKVNLEYLDLYNEIESNKIQKYPQYLTDPQKCKGVISNKTCTTDCPQGEYPQLHLTQFYKICNTTIQMDSTNTFTDTQNASNSTNMNSNASKSESIQDQNIQMESIGNINSKIENQNSSENRTNSDLNTNQIVGICIGVLTLLLLIGFGVYIILKRYKNKHDNTNHKISLNSNKYDKSDVIKQNNPIQGIQIPGTTTNLKDEEIEHNA